MTAFSEREMAFTRAAHQAAQTQVYPAWFPDGVEFEDTTDTARDLDYAIDCKLALTCTRLPFKGRHARPVRAPLRLAVQERYRRPRWMADYGDQITITEWNLSSGQPSELHKLDAQVFVYGFYDQDADLILRAGAFSVAAIAAGLVSGQVNYMRQRRNGDEQEFIVLNVPELRRVGAELFSFERADPSLPAPATDPEPVAAADWASTSDTYRDPQGRTYRWDNEPGIWRRVGSGRLCVVEPELEEL